MHEEKGQTLQEDQTKRKWRVQQRNMGMNLMVNSALGFTRLIASSTSRQQMGRVRTDCISLQRGMCCS